MHATTGRWRLGLALALLTTVCWGVQPIVLKIALDELDPYTIIWARFAFAGLALFCIMAPARVLPAMHAIRGRGWALLAVGLVGLLGNYIFYTLALRYVTPTVTQVVVQLAPMFFLFGALIFFKERFSRAQWAGLAILVAGLLLFFNHRLPELSRLSNATGLGALLVVLASVTWAAYGLAQKALLDTLGSQQILLFIYAGAALALWPWKSLEHFDGASSLVIWMVIVSCLSTLLAYGSFAEALRHWEASRVGAVVATAPLFTLAAMALLGHVAPEVMAAEGLNELSLAGAMLVVVGSALSALGGQRS